MTETNTKPKSELLKFRPSLTTEQISYLVVLCQQVTDPNDFYEERMKHSIRRVCVPLLAKVEVGAINPSHTLSQRHADKLQVSAAQKRYDSGEMSAEEEREFEAKVLGI